MVVRTLLPPQGTPGKFDPRNPTLIPNFDRNRVLGDGSANVMPPTVNHSSPAGFLVADPRANASATATIGGNVTTGDEITLELLNAVFPNGLFSHTYTTVSGDTVTSIAESLADLFNDDAALAQFDVEVDVAGSVLTFNQSGPVGNFTTLQAPLGEPSKITVGGTALTGDIFGVLFTGPALSVLTPATVLADLGGTFAPTDTVALTFTNSGVAGLPVTKTYTVLAGDTAASVAAGLTALINADTTLEAADITAIANGNEIQMLQQGAIGNSTVVTRTVSGSETVTFIPSNGHMGGGSGQPGGVLVTSALTTTQNATTMGANLATAINADATLAANTITGTNSSGVVTIAVPAAAEPISYTAWVNTITPTATITGAVAAGDVLNLTFNAAYLPGGTHAVSWTALLGETTTTLAANLSNTINADPVLIAAGITASPSTNVITFGYQQDNGQIRFAQSVSPGSETITLSTTPTETITVLSKNTETVVINDTLASVVATIVSSAPAATDTVALTFTNSGVPGLPVTKTYTLIGADSATTIAAGLVALINGDTTLQDADISASNLAGVITITQQGVIGNTTVVSATVTETGGGTETVTFTPSNGHMSGGAGGASGLLSGGTGPILAANNFEFAPSNGGISAFYYGQPYDIGYDVLAQMVAQGMPIV